MNKCNVWEQDGGYDSDDAYYWIEENSFKRRFSELRVNNYLDIYVKRIALKAAPSVVSVQIYSGGKGICWGSGFIIGCNSTVDTQFESTIITSATLLRTDATLNTLMDDLKVIVILSNGEECDGEIEAYDFHYNLAAIKIRVGHSLEFARLRHVDDLIMVDPSKISTPGEKSFQQHPDYDSDLFRLVPGIKVIALGRYYDDEKSNIMASPGEFSIEQCRFDCKELLRSTCRITRCGIGGPLVNCTGEVIGVNFFALEFTPFLPINIVSKWWKHFKKFGDYCRPWLGMELSNLFTIKVCIWERIIQKFPDIKKGIIIDEVTPNSPAGSAGVHPDDIIIECDGTVVNSSLQVYCINYWKIYYSICSMQFSKCFHCPLSGGANREVSM
ncbi:hypothetical protein PTKIN_Ptkin06aG0219600 [Pterospermum kingtungense]